jgi:hypothetical protein
MTGSPHNPCTTGAICQGTTEKHTHLCILPHKYKVSVWVYLKYPYHFCERGYCASVERGAGSGVFESGE